MSDSKTRPVKDKPKRPRGVSPKLAVLEGISSTDFGQDAKILKPFAKMLGWDCIARKCNRRGSARENKDVFLQTLFNTKAVFLHLSAHGAAGAIYLDSESDQEAAVSIADIQDFGRRAETAEQDPPAHRFITMSTCGNIDSSFSLGLHETVNAVATIAPIGKIDFSESILFATMFYFTLLPRIDQIKKEAHEEILAQYVDSFNRTKTAYLNIGGTGAHRLEYWWKKEQFTVS